MAAEKLLPLLPENCLTDVKLAVPEWCLQARDTTLENGATGGVTRRGI